MISRSIFKILKFLPLFQMLFLWLNKSSPWRSSPLSCQEGFCKCNFCKKFSEKQVGGAVLLLWPINFSPFGIKRQKWRIREVFYNKDMKVNTLVGQRIYDTDRVIVEALPLPKTLFPFQSKTKNRNILGSTLVLALALEE